MLRKFRKLLDEQKAKIPGGKYQRGISDEDAKRMLAQLHEEDMIGGPAITSKTSMGHLRTTKFSMSKEPNK